MLIHGNLDSHSRLLGDKPCLIHSPVCLTYKEIARRIHHLACRLATKIVKGDRVLIKLPAPAAQLIYFLSAVKAGGSCILVDPSTSEEVCAELIKAHHIKLYINENFPIPDGTASMLPIVNPDDIFLGALSSGSTGAPKVVWRDHQSWTHAFPAQSTIFNLGRSDVLYLAGSLAYTANLNAGLHILAEGGTVVIAGHNMPRTWVRDLADHHATAVFMVPANYKMLVKTMEKPLSQLRSIVTAGAKIDLPTVKALMKYFPRAGICEYYGASEVGHVSYCAAEDLLQHPRSVGKAFPGVKISIIDQTIWVESPYIAPQYKPKATVGDLGRIDHNGYLYLLGRKQGIINSGGIKVIPEQIEEILRHCPGVAEAVVGGVDDPIRGQKICAWIVKNTATLTVTDILEFCRKKLLHHCCPQKIVFIDEIPLNANGKADRLRLKNKR